MATNNTQGTINKRARNDLAKPLPIMLIVGWVSYIAMVVINVSFEAFRFAGVTSSEVSNQVFAWFTPAGYAFSIWALIYLALGVWMLAATQSVIKHNKNESVPIALLAMSNLLNVVWLTLFHLQLIEASLVVIILFLVTTGFFYYIEHKDNADPARWIPASIYFGWITVATIANTTHLASRYIEATPILNEVSTMALVVAVLLIGYAVSRLENDAVYPLVLIWATVAVGVHLLDASPMTAAAVFALTAVGAVITYVGFSGARISPSKHRAAGVR